MQTNKTISRDSELYKAAQKLLSAAHNYWEVYHKECGSGAVVWLEDDGGHFVLFTRGEYREAILTAAGVESLGKPALFAPFEKRDEERKNETT